MKRPSRSKKRYKNDDDRPYFKRREQVEVTQDFIENIGDPDFPRYGWIVKKSRPLMSDPGYEYLIERDPEFAADDGYDKSYWVYDNEIQRGRYNEGTYWPTPENERIPIYTLELSRVDDDDDDEYVETPMKYSGTYYSDDEAFEAAEQLAAEYADEDGKFEVTIMAGEYQIGDDGDIYGDPYVDGSIQTGRGWKMMESRKKLVKEGAGAGYTVTIKNTKLDNVKVKKVGDGDWEFEADIVKDNYMIEAADYYNLFCPMDSEFGGEEWVEVAGKVRGVCWWYDEDYEVEQEISGTKQDISFMYGHGWVHANLPEDGHIVSDHMESDGHDTWQIESIELDAPQLAECVNYCHEHFLDEDEPEEDEEDGEQVNESSDEGWHTVTDAFEEFEQRLWSFTKHDMKGRRDAFSRCTNAMEKALREYYNEVVL